MRKPRVFIGSSKESLAVLKVLSGALEDLADVVPWTDQDSFREPGDFFLDSLIQAAYTFDIAILVFGKDDILISRKKHMPAPRDNVVFELGLFMSTDRKRTIVVSPRVWRANLKILSDLQGLNLAEYDPPKNKRDLASALQGVIRRVRKQVQSLQMRPQVRGPSSVAVVWRQIEEQLAVASSVSHQIQNIALDMEVTWRSLHDEILANPDRHDVECLAMFLDHRSKRMKGASSDSVSTKIARIREREIKDYCSRHAADLKRRGIRFACRVYADVPLIHGFLLNRKQLFMSMCAINSRGRLVGSPNPYLFVEKPDARRKDIGADHLIGVFESWFAHLWKKGRRVWPT